MNMTKEIKNTEIPEIFEDTALKADANASSRQNYLSKDHSDEMIPVATISEKQNILIAPNQLGLYFTQLNTDKPIYTIYERSEIVGDLNIDKFKQALEILYRRHISYRFCFKREMGDVYITTHENPLPFQMMDCALSQPGIVIDSVKPEVFELEHGPLVKASLIKLSHERYQFIWQVHHLIYDGWSSMIFYRELNALYASNLDISVLPKLEIDYLDFAVWYGKQKTWLQKQHLPYWIEKLRNIPTTSTFAADYPVPQVPTHAGNYFTCSLSKNQLVQIQSLCQEYKISLYNYCIGILGLLLHYNTEQDTIVIGGPFANRKHLNTENLVGLLINTLPIRIDFKKTDTFLKLLFQIKNTVHEMRTHQELPLSEIIHHLSVQRHSAFHPLFQVVCVKQNPETSKLTLDGFKVEKIEFPIETTQFHLTLEMVKQNDELHFRFEYSTELYKHSTITRLAHHFINLTLQTLTDPHKTIGHYNYLSTREWDTQIIDWNQTYVPHNLNETVLDHIQRSVAAHGSKVAVEDDHSQLTYQQLAQYSDHLAYILKSSGVLQPESMIGISTDKNCLLIVGILAILKSGGAYLPLDPSYPEERLKFMLADSNAPVLITEKKYAQEYEHFLGRIVYIDEIDFASSPVGPMNFAIHSRNLAYVIYTSGSTGLPKGVLIEHRSLLNFILSQKDHLKLDSSQRWLSFLSYSFDFFIFKLFGSLLSGASLYLMDRNADNLLEKLKHELHVRKINIVGLPPTILKALSDDTYPDLQCVISGGEKCSEEVVNAYAPYVRLVDAYGPTEITIYATLSSPLKVNEPLNIGSPLDNVQLYILDQYLKPKPIGIPGEIYIGGVGVARGYLNREDLTKERFIPNPFSKDKNDKLYRTGDIAKWNDDGKIIYIGRADKQVKLRGLRIELQEIECCLHKHDAIARAVVLVHNDLLIAFVIKNNPQENVLPASITKHLSRLLPDYMVPRQYYFIEKVPLTANDKLDSNALLEIYNHRQQQASAQRLETFSDPIQKQLFSIAKDVLKSDHITSEDRFFEVGFDSIRIMVLCEKINKFYKSNLRPIDLFAHSTIRDLANFLQAQKSSDQQKEHNPIWSCNRAGSKPPLFFIHPWIGGAEVYYQFAQYLDKNQPFYAFEPYNLFSNRDFLTSMEALATHYVQQVLEIAPDGHFSLGGWSSGGVVAYEMAQQLLTKNKPAPNLYLIDSTIEDLWSETSEPDIIMLIKSLLEKEGHYERLPESYRSRLEKVALSDLKMTRNYYAKPYGGKAVLFKANIPMSGKNNLSEKNGLEKFIAHLHVEYFNANHVNIIHDQQNIKRIADYISEYGISSEL